MDDLGEGVPYIIPDSIADNGGKHVEPAFGLERTYQYGPGQNVTLMFVGVAITVAIFGGAPAWMMVSVLSENRPRDIAVLESPFAILFFGCWYAFIFAWAKGTWIWSVLRPRNEYIQFKDQFIYHYNWRGAPDVIIPFGSNIHAKPRAWRMQGEGRPWIVSAGQSSFVVFSDLNRFDSFWRDLRAVCVVTFEGYQSELLGPEA